MHNQYFTPELIGRLGNIVDRKAYSVGVAFAIAGCLQLPPAPVESPETYFVENLAELGERAIMVFNEVRPLDWEDTDQLVRQAWLARYMALYAYRDNSIATGCSAVPTLLDLFGIGSVLPASVITFLVEKQDEVLCTVKTAVEAIHNHKLL